MKRRTVKMSDVVTAKLKELAKNAHGSVQVGFIENAQASIAFWDEFGHKGRFPAPARPFFRTMVAKESSAWPAMMAGEMKCNGMNGHRTMSFMGEEIEGQLKQSIIDTNEPPLSAVTLRLRKKFGNQPQNIRLRDVFSAISDVRKGKTTVSGTQAKPLVWTGQMLQSTSYRVTG